MDTKIDRQTNTQIYQTDIEERGRDREKKMERDRNSERTFENLLTITGQTHREEEEDDGEDGQPEPLLQRVFRLCR